jgi:hypothetical protein
MARLKSHKPQIAGSFLAKRCLQQANHHNHIHGTNAHTHQARRGQWRDSFHIGMCLAGLLDKIAHGGFPADRFMWWPHYATQMPF